MNKLNYLILILVLLITGCSSDPDEPMGQDFRFVPTDVIVKTKADFTTEQVFEFINGYDHDVEYIYNGVYLSDLPSSELQYVLDYINEKPYTHYGPWSASGYLHYQTQQITVFTRFFQIKNTENQQDWLQTMEELQLTEKTDGEARGHIIYFHVPAGQEKEWEDIFKQLDFVEWAELNYYVSIQLHN